MKEEISIVLYPLDRYIYFLVSPYYDFVKSNLSIDLKEKVKEYIQQNVNELRKISEMWWVFPKDIELNSISNFFTIESNDRIITDELSYVELLHTSKYSSFEPVLAELNKKVKNSPVKKVNACGFHLNDCLKNLVEKMINRMKGKNIRINVIYKLTDYGISDFVLSYVKKAYKMFQNSHASTKYALARGVKE